MKKYLVRDITKEQYNDPSLPRMGKFIPVYGNSQRDAVSRYVSAREKKKTLGSLFG